MYGKLALSVTDLAPEASSLQDLCLLAIIAFRLIGVTHTRCYMILYETPADPGERPGTYGFSVPSAPWQERGTRSRTLWDRALGVFVGAW